jgi:hypothetical protein
LVLERSLRIYAVDCSDLKTPLRFVCEKQLYFNAMDVEIINLQQCNMNNENNNSDDACVCQHLIDCSSTGSWHGYAIAVAGSDGLQLYNFCSIRNEFIVIIIIFVVVVG